MAADLREHRIERQNEQCGHREIEDTQPPRIGEEAAQPLTERRPYADARQADEDEYERHPDGVAAIVRGELDRRRGGQHHHPCFRIDPLKRDRLDERHRARFAVVSAHFARRADAPREIQQIDDACGFEQRVEDRDPLECLAEAEADRQHQDRDAGADAEHVRQRAAEAEIDARCEQHRVVRAGRDRGDEREQHARGQRAEGEIVHGDALFVCGIKARMTK
ncbi:hypothetical protein DP43_3664 [Burkholderia pseudomallei]|nr:hypothetical protein DP43_3664 [Burkholderia pseudomallei]